MPRRMETMLGQPIRVPAHLQATCQICFSRGGTSNGRLVTDGTEIADVAEEIRHNGRFTAPTGRAAVWLDCPDCGSPVQFPVPNIKI
jgi:hypothetical protein